MNVPLYLLLSGDAFFLGLGLTVAGASCTWWASRLARGLVWGGTALAVLSAVPVHAAGYVLLLASVVWWQVTQERSVPFRRASTAALFFVAAGLATAEVRERSLRTLHASVGRHLAVIGDSLSAGAGSPSDTTWPVLLATRCQGSVANLARAGAVLSDGVAQGRRIPPGPTIVIVELGGNDILTGTTPGQFSADLSSLLAALAGRDRRVLMFELPLLPFQNSYGRIQRQVCRDSGVALIPRSVLAAALTRTGHTSDGLHLSLEGHAWLAAEVSAWLCAACRCRSAAR